MQARFLPPIAAFAGMLIWSLPVMAEPAVWQWSVALDAVKSAEQKEPPRAFLWIPPTCERVRAVVVGQHNMEEEPILEHPDFRQAMEELGFAMVWVTPGFDLAFRADQGAGETFEAMMQSLAAESGYDELAFAPVVPIGHSAAASYPWNFAAWKPERTLAAISVSGQWPYFKQDGQPEFDLTRLSGVPGLVTLGEYEWAQQRAAEGLKQRQQNPQLPLSFLAEAGAGHFDVSDEKVRFLALYLKKAAQFRLPESTAVNGRIPALRPMAPDAQGWLTDRWRMDQPPRFAAAPVSRYQGNKEEAFWSFDEEMALAIEQLSASQRGKKPQLVGYLQDGKMTPQNKDTHQQVTLNFQPLKDGVSFKLQGGFLHEVPEGRPERWTNRQAGSPISHAVDGGPVILQRICGPVRQTGPDTFRLAFYRMGMSNARRSNEIWLMASHPGDAHYKRAAQQAVLRFPLRNEKGAAQTLHFPAMPDPLSEDATRVTLQATSSADVPVSYYVREGPAFVEDHQLVLTAIPPRAKRPVKITVVAWQWGRSIEPLLQTAEPVSQTFFVGRKAVAP